MLSSPPSPQTATVLRRHPALAAALVRAGLPWPETEDHLTEVLARCDISWVGGNTPDQWKHSLQRARAEARPRTLSEILPDELPADTDPADALWLARKATFLPALPTPPDKLKKSGETHLFFDRAHENAIACSLPLESNDRAVPRICLDQLRSGLQRVPDMVLVDLADGDASWDTWERCAGATVTIGLHPALEQAAAFRAALQGARWSPLLPRSASPFRLLACGLALPRSDEPDAPPSFSLRDNLRSLSYVLERDPTGVPSPTVSAQDLADWLEHFLSDTVETEAPGWGESWQKLWEKAQPPLLCPASWNPEKAIKGRRAERTWLQSPLGWQPILGLIENRQLLPVGDSRELMLAEMAGFFAAHVHGPGAVALQEALLDRDALWLKRMRRALVQIYNTELKSRSLFTRFAKLLLDHVTEGDPNSRHRETFRSWIFALQEEEIQCERGDGLAYLPEIALLAREGGLEEAQAKVESLDPQKADIPQCRRAIAHHSIFRIGPELHRRELSPCTRTTVEEAIALLEEDRESLHENAGGRGLLIRCYTALGRYEDAEKVLSRAANETEQATIRFFWAVALHARNETELLSKAFDNVPDAPLRRHSNLLPGATIAALHGHPRARDFLRQIAEFPPVHAMGPQPELALPVFEGLSAVGWADLLPQAIASIERDRPSLAPLLRERLKHAQEPMGEEIADAWKIAAGPNMRRWGIVRLPNEQKIMGFD